MVTVQTADLALARWIVQRVEQSPGSVFVGCHRRRLSTGQSTLSAIQLHRAGAAVGG